MLKTFSVVLLAVLLAACATTGQSSDSFRQSTMKIVNTMAVHTSDYLKTFTEAQTIDSAQESVKSNLKDPNSAQFQNVRIVSFGSGKVICGRVNAKNSYGGYGGFKKFVASPFNAVIERKGSEVDEIANTGLNAACSY